MRPLRTALINLLILGVVIAGLSHSASAPVRADTRFCRYQVGHDVPRMWDGCGSLKAASYRRCSPRVPSPGRNEALEQRMRQGC